MRLKKNCVLLLTLSFGLLPACGADGGMSDTPEATGVKGDASAINTNQTGTNGGYFYSFWTNGGGSVDMTLDGGNGYSVQWTNCGDFTCGKGWSTGSGHTISYSGSYSNSGGGAFGIYGWTTNPLVEYYIVEAVGSGGSPASGTHVGTVASDGGTYDIYKHQQVNQPSIQGTATFWQYISVRQSHRTSGTITIQNHFNAWAQAGMNLGSHNYQILLTEGWNGSGSARATISEGGGSSSGGSSSSGSSGGGSSSGGSSSGGSSSGGTTTGSCTATFSANAWSNGFTGTVTVKAGSSAINGWTVKLNMGSNTVTQIWGAAQSGNTFKNVSYNGSLGAGASTSFGFNGSFSGTFAAPTVASCTSP